MGHRAADGDARGDEVVAAVFTAGAGEVGIEAFVDLAVAVFVDAGAAGFFGGVAGHGVALGAETIGGADHHTVGLAGADACVARGAFLDVFEAFVGFAVAVFVDVGAAQLDAVGGRLAGDAVADQAQTVGAATRGAGAGAGAETDVARAELADSVEAFVDETVAVIVDAIAAQFVAGGDGDRVADDAGAVDGTDRQARGAAGAFSCLAGDAQRQAGGELVDFAVAVVVDAIAAQFVAGLAGDRAALDAGAVGGTDGDAGNKACAYAGFTGCAGIEAFVGLAVAVVVDAVAA